MTTKDTNPKDLVGIKKWSLSYVPARVLAVLSVAMQEGANKYGSHNYRVAGVRAMVYWDATIRHLFAWKEGENFDPDSNINHIAKAIASLVVLLDGMMEGNWNDDRPVAIDPDVFKELDKRVAALSERYPQPVPPCIQVNKSWADAAAEDTTIW